MREGRRREALSLANRRFPRACVRSCLQLLWRSSSLGLMAAVALGVLSRLVAVPLRAQPAEPGRARASMAVAAQGGQTLPEDLGHEVSAFIQRHRKEARPAESFHFWTPDQCPDAPRVRQEFANESRSCLVFERSAVLEKVLVPQAQDTVVLCAAVASAQPDVPGGSAALRIIADEPGGPRLLAERRWGPESRQAKRWELVSVDVGELAGEQARLRFEIALSGERAPVLYLSDARLVGPRAEGRPNVLLITLETTRSDHCSLYGYERPTTPFLEELAHESVVFESAYSQSSWTRPSMASLLTGLYPSQHGAVVMFDRLPDEAVMLPEMLRGHGYVTGGFCNWQCRPISAPVFGYDQGYDVFHSVRGYFEVQARRVLRWLDEERPRPFFALVHVLEPHSPYQGPGAFRDMFDPGYRGRLRRVAQLSTELLRGNKLSQEELQYVSARYDGEIRYVDEVLRQFVLGLKERGLWDDTLVIITADHGEELGEHGGWGHSQDLYPEKLRVPLLVKLAGGAHGGLRVKGVASGVDLVPTILSALGLPVASYLPGIDLLHAGLATGRTGREYHYAEFWPMVKRARGSAHWSVLSEEHQLIWLDGEGGAPELYLYDLIADPAAQENLADRLPEVRERYAGMVRERYGRTGYTLAANGDGRTRALSGRVQVEGRIVALEGLRTENDDSFGLSADRKVLAFALTVGADDDLLRFQTEPENAPVTVDVELDAEQAPCGLVRLGPLAKPCQRLPLLIPAGRCAVDADVGEARTYEVGQELGLYIWRVGTRAGGEAAVQPDQETLRILKDLGYL